MRIRPLIGFCLLWLGFVVTSPAQASPQLSASVSGFVTDESSAAVSGAAVSARDLETGAQRAVVTDNSGRYRLAALAVGEYEIVVKKDGFQQTLRSGLHLAINQEATADFVLKIGEIRQQVTVTEDAPAVSTTTVDIS